MTSTTESNLFPCPRCGAGRGQAENVCDGCGWDPNPPDPVFKPDNSQKAPPLDARTIVGTIFIVVGILLATGGSLAFLILLLLVDASVFELVGPAIQIIAALLAIFSGYLELRHHPNGKRLFCIAIGMVIISFVYFMFSMLMFFGTQ